MLIRQELCESGGGRPGPPVPNSPYGLCGRKAPAVEDGDDSDAEALTLSQRSGQLITHAHTHARTSPRTHTYIHVHAYIHTHTLARTHACMHTHTHTHTPVSYTHLRAHETA